MSPQPSRPELEIVAELSVRPGNVAVTPGGRVFSTLHPFDTPDVQLVEIVDGAAVPYPSAALQKYGAEPDAAHLDTPLGTVADQRNRIWTVDIGQGLGIARVWAFDLATDRVVETIDLPLDVAPVGSLVQDLAVDERNGWIYLADIGTPGIIAVDLERRDFRRFEHPSLEPEDLDMVIDGEIVLFGGQPARVGVDPITLSHDRETLFFAPMSGTSWYSLPTRLFRDGADDAALGAAIERVGPKPISDGSATGADGVHYFTDLTRHALVGLRPDGGLFDVVRDDRLRWPDNVAVGPDGYLYATVNQLTTSTTFTGLDDRGEPPYYIYRVAGGTVSG